METNVFIDPTPITPKELTDCEMGELVGGALVTPTAVIFATTCSEMFGGTLALAIAASIKVNE